MTDKDPPHKHPSLAAPSSAVANYIEAFEKAKIDFIYLSTDTEGRLEISTHNVNTLLVKIAYQEVLAKRFKEGHLALLTYLDQLSADPTDRVPPEAVTDDFWSVIRPEWRPKVGDTYQGLLSLREVLAGEITEMQESASKFNEISQWLSSARKELELVLSGHATPDRLVVISKKWCDLNAEIPAKPEPPIITEKWGDMDSSDDDDNIPLILASLAKSKDSSVPGIRLPGDFEECFPAPGRQLRRFCRRHNWTVELVADVKLRSQGLIVFEEDGTSISTSKPLEEIHRLALVSLYTSISSLWVKPQGLAVGESTEVALTYVCALIASEKLANANKELLTVALKQKDGNKSALFDRFYSLCRTGNSAMKMVIEAVDKCLSKFARDLDVKSLDSATVEQISKRAFTSLDGMLANCSRTTTRTRVVFEETTDRRGKTSKTKRTERVPGVLSADLPISNMPLKPDELTRVLTLREKFNDRKSVVERRLLVRADRETNLLAAPEVCKSVMNEAYAKTSSYKSILKSRRDLIRIEATRLNNGKKPDPSHWATAKSTVLQNTPDIPEAVFRQLVWE